MECAHNGSRGSVAALRKVDQANQVGPWAVSGLEQSAKRVPRTVKANDTQPVSEEGEIDELGEPGTVTARSREGIGEQPRSSGLDEASVPGLRVLVTGGDAGAAQAMPGRSAAAVSISVVSGIEPSAAMVALFSGAESSP